MKLADFAALDGREIGLSGWIAIDQAMIDAFAAVTGDHQFIHVDPVRAAETPFGTTIAHGFLTLSLVARMLGDVAEGFPEDLKTSINYGSNGHRFLNPVRCGSRIRGRFMQEAMVPRGAGWLRTLAFTVEIEGEERPALVGTLLTYLEASG